MGRLSLEIDKEKLENCIRTLEKNKNFDGLNDFWEKVATNYGGVSSTTLKSRAKTYNIQINVERKKIAGLSDMKNVRKAINKEKPRNRKKPSEKSIQMMKDRVIDHGQQNLLPLVDKIENGNIKACIKLHCLECMGYSRESVRECTSPACQFFWLRPYQNDKAGEEKEETDDD